MKQAYHILPLVIHFNLKLFFKIPLNFLSLRIFLINCFSYFIILLFQTFILLLKLIIRCILKVLLNFLFDSLKLILYLDFKIFLRLLFISFHLFVMILITYYLLIKDYFINSLPLVYSISLFIYTASLVCKISPLLLPILHSLYICSLIHFSDKSL